MSAEPAASDEPVETFIGTVAELRLLERTFDVRDPVRVVDTFPWWRRCVAHLLWHTFFQRVLRRRFLSPFASIRATLVARALKKDGDGERR